MDHLQPGRRQHPSVQVGLHCGGPGMTAFMVREDYGVRRLRGTKVRRYHDGTWQVGQLKGSNATYRKWWKSCRFGWEFFSGDHGTTISITVMRRELNVRLRKPTKKVYKTWS